MYQVCHFPNLICGQDNGAGTTAFGDVWVPSVHHYKIPLEGTHVKWGFQIRIEKYVPERIFFALAVENSRKKEFRKLYIGLVLHQLTHTTDLANPVGFDYA